MDRDEAIKLLKGGADGVAEWNRRRAAGEEVPELKGIDLCQARLNRINLEETELTRVDLRDAQLEGASLSRVALVGCDLSGASLRNAALRGGRLVECHSWGTNFTDADLAYATLVSVDFRQVGLLNTRLFGSRMFDTSLIEPGAFRTDFEGVFLNRVRFIGVDLTQVTNLDKAALAGPCFFDTRTLAAFKGDLPEVFLGNCGLRPWEILAAKLYDPVLTAEQINDIQYKIFELRTSGPLHVGGVFISYSHSDSEAVHKLYERLKKEDITVWLDRHDLVAGDLQRQVDRGLRLMDVVLLVLSESSIESDWVEHELEIARKKEKEEKRDVLCPIALDDSWKAKTEGDVLWRQLKKKNVLDFSRWQTDEFEGQFRKLLDGLKIYYPAPGTAKEEAPA